MRFSIWRPQPRSGSISFDIDWHGPITSKTTIDNSTLGFKGTFVQNSATIKWSGENDLGFSFESNPQGVTTVLAELGRKRNGVFFHGSSQTGVMPMI